MSTNAVSPKNPAAAGLDSLWKVSRPSDAALALGVLAMIGLMILPVRPWMLDIFLTLNLALGGVLLMAAVLTPTGTRIFTFPTILIVTTLFRLALDVSSTRLILTEADAGHVIQSFGDFAASGSVVVGLVVFLIITMVQLIVISKGAERTANATAIFVRESIPGRQMAIDADANAGRISQADVAKARKAMGIEVEFYSRMYGAMEFIKGDSIAGLVIAAINIVGGLIVGVAVNHMAVLDAVETYTLLTVGAGLVSQIPALIGSVAGTILVSRVSTDDADGGLGETVVGQVKALPQAMIGAAVLMLLLGLAPGMPTLTFLAFAAALGVGGIRLQRAPIAKAPPAPVKPSMLAFRLNTRKLSQQDLAAVDAEMPAILKHFRSNYGILVRLPEASTLVEDDALPAIGFYRSGVGEAAGDDWAAVRNQLFLHLKLQSARYFRLEAAQEWLDLGGNIIPAGVNLLVAQGLDLKSLYRILARLVEERITIKDIRSIVEALLLCDPPISPKTKKKDPQPYADAIRKAIRDQAGRHYVREFFLQPNSDFYVTQPAGTLVRSMQEYAEGSPDAYDRVVQTLKTALAGRNAPGLVPIIAIDQVYRRALWEICESLFQSGELPKPVLVLSREEAAVPDLKQIRRTSF
jgi:type III secretion protein V